MTMSILSKISQFWSAHDKPATEQNVVLTASQLQRLVPFNDMPESHLGEILKIAQVQQWPARKKLFKRGQDDNRIHYLLEGSVDLLDENFNITSITPDTAASCHPLDNTRPHRLSAITRMESRLLQFDRDALDRLLTWEQATSGSQEDGHEEEDWMSSLLESELFTKVPPANIQQLFSTFKSQDVAAGDVVVQEGQEGDHFYVIAAGKAVVTRNRVDGTETLATLSAGHFFGEEALIGGTTRNASITMISPGKLMVLEKEAFKKLLEEPVLRQLSATEISQLQNTDPSVVLLDVRLPGEYKHDHIEGSINVPLNRLRERMEAFSRDKTYIVCANGGSRSELAAYLLVSGGFQAFLGENSAP